MPYHAIDAETETSYYSFLYDWRAWQSLVSRDPGLPCRLVASCCGLPVGARRAMSFHTDAPEFSFAHRHKSLACPADHHSYTHLSHPLKMRAFNIAAANGWEVSLETCVPSLGAVERIYVDALVKTPAKSKAVIFHPERAKADDLLAQQNELAVHGIDALWVIPHARALPPPEPVPAIAVEDRGVNPGPRGLAFATLLYSQDDQPRALADSQALASFLLDKTVYVPAFGDEEATLNLHATSSRCFACEQATYVFAGVSLQTASKWGHIPHNILRHYPRALAPVARILPDFLSQFRDDLPKGRPVEIRTRCGSCKRLMTPVSTRPAVTYAGDRNTIANWTCLLRLETLTSVELYDGHELLLELSRIATYGWLPTDYTHLQRSERFDPYPPVSVPMTPRLPLQPVTKHL